ncbi:single-stranded DNA-binding protein [Nodosilinea nodulosa]|uniref:single-stranded DNA-binding protein n=1 Tax=Nodosilinea nodulosa TaxID=416001 RepID=UPI0002F7B2AE|nr:single-stranded DNA-binding protein [Nodosilinea nodulosa]
MNNTALTLQILSYNAPDPTRNMVEIACRIFTYDEDQSLDVLVTSYTGMPPLNLAQTQLGLIFVIGELQVVRSAEGHDRLEMQASVIQHIPQLPNWENHPMANAITLSPIAYSTAVGNVGSVSDRDHVRTAPNGKPVCNRSMAVAGNRDRNHTSWFKADFWDKLADVADRYLPKGTKFGVTGTLKFNAYTTKNQQLRIEPTITVQNLELLGSKRDDQSSDSGAKYVPAPVAPPAPPAPPASGGASPTAAISPDPNSQPNLNDIPF